MTATELVEPDGRARALRFRVRGMDCPSCASKIETALTRLPGVSDVRVNYQRELLELSLDETQSPRARIEKQVTSLGYGVDPQPTTSDLALQEGASAPGDTGDNEQTNSPFWRTPKAMLAGGVGLLWAAGFVAEHAGLPTGAWSYAPAAVLGLLHCGRRALAAAFAGSPFSIEMLMSVATAGALAIGAVSEAGVVVFPSRSVKCWRGSRRAVRAPVSSPWRG